MSAPGSGALDAGELGAVPAVAAFEVVDPSFGAGAPFDLVAEGSSVCELSAGGGRSVSAWDRHAALPELVEVMFDRGQAVTTISGHRPWWASGAAGDAFDRGCQLWCVGRVSDLDGVIEDDAVGVVGDLGFVAELHRLTQPSLADRAGVGVVQADQP